MATTTKNIADDVQGQVLESIRKSQEAAVAALRNWTEAVEQLTPRRDYRPLTENVPSPTELVDSVFDFTGELLQAQREFLHSAIRVTAPATERIKDQAAKAARTTS